MGRPGVAHAGQRRGRRARRRAGEGEGAHAGVHPLAGRQRRAGLSLAMGNRSARPAPDLDQPVLEERARAGRLRHRRVHPVRARRRRGALHHRQRRGARRDRGRGRGVGRILQRAGNVHVRGDARRQRPPRAVPGQVLGDRQRDLGRLGTRPLGCGHLCAKPHPLRRRDARVRSRQSR